MIEGGAAVLTACLQAAARAHLIDCVVVTIAPVFVRFLCVSRSSLPCFCISHIATACRSAACAHWTRQLSTSALLPTRRPRASRAWCSHLSTLLAKILWCLDTSTRFRNELRARPDCLPSFGSDGWAQTSLSEIKSRFVRLKSNSTRAGCVSKNTTTCELPKSQKLTLENGSHCHSSSVQQHKHKLQHRQRSCDEHGPPLAPLGLERERAREL